MLHVFEGTLACVWTCGGRGWSHVFFFMFSHLNFFWDSVSAWTYSLPIRYTGKPVSARGLLTLGSREWAAAPGVLLGHWGSELRCWCLCHKDFAHEAISPAPKGGGGSGSYQTQHKCHCTNAWTGSVQNSAVTALWASTEMLMTLEDAIWDKGQACPKSLSTPALQFLLWVSKTACLPRESEREREN